VGVYRTHVRLVDVVEPERATLDGRIEGSMGTITGHAAFTLADAPGGDTTLTYTGIGRIDGPLARLDGSIAERLATSLIDQGLRALDARLAPDAQLAPDARLAPDEPRTTEVPE
jgi:carbon monoxide dehydrogenase subunit G